MLVAPGDGAARLARVEFVVRYTRKSTLAPREAPCWAPMAGPPLLFVSYSGVLGGAERVLLDCVTRAQRPVVVACPDGPLAEQLKAADVTHVAVANRPLQLGAAHL